MALPTTAGRRLSVALDSCGHEHAGDADASLLQEGLEDDESADDAEEDAADLALHGSAFLSRCDTDVSSIK